jgi:hypothetical protein
MILFSHPRSGTEWFLGGLLDYKYGMWEMFNDLNDLEGTVEYEYWSKISFNAKLTMLKVGAKTNKSFKIHFVDLHREMQKDTWPLLKQVIDLHEKYLLTRNNVKESILSALLSRYNDNNYHRSNDLKRTGIVSKKDVEYFYKIIYEDTQKLINEFDYKEHFIYENLLSKSQIPQTIRWDPSKSNVQQRFSINKINLIDNKEEVLCWIDELIQGNHVQSHPWTGVNPI